ncbi:hypothetical protein PoB_002559400 [Plakobranchus ocellatus]|uniref:Secreted protein n=1 Tax=Plakobranchus ocellatus TaxID=259542 RepID=A0AAV3ZUS3_9GAST|nr:hypothetical protein PoB_002559400 [Plakobranchus ocellatus]
MAASRLSLLVKFLQWFGSCRRHISVKSPSSFINCTLILVGSENVTWCPKYCGSFWGEEILACLDFPIIMFASQEFLWLNISISQSLYLPHKSFCGLTSPVAVIFCTLNDSYALISLLGAL